ncbi:DUF3592 domain-containing protein [Candidatus Nomurabacteria bacterium]|nr:DUF3592 domain-containing protein [Candidatus Nomurabacteria bacterium]
MTKSPSFGFGIMLLFGIVFAGVAIGIFVNSYLFLQTAEHTQGKVVEIVERRDSDGDMMYSPKVAFETPTGESIAFVSAVSSNFPLYDVGEGVDVAYQPNNPHKAKLEGSVVNWIVPVIFGLFGSVFLVVGVIGLVHAHHRKKEIAFLMQSGNRIVAKVERSMVDRSYKINNKSPYRLYAVAHDPMRNTVKEYKSEYIWYNPNEFAPPGKEITVMVHPQNPDIYYMDTSFLPKLK